MSMTHDTSVYLAYRLLDDGRIIDVVPELWNIGLLVIGDANHLWYDNSWEYEQQQDALSGACLLGSNGEC